MSEDRLLRALYVAEYIKKSEKNFNDSESTRNEDYDADGVLKTTKPDPTKTKTKNKSNETIINY